MKTRSGFVSNSSSSSFTCQVCGETQSGMDMSMSECGMTRCENRHTICESHERKVTPLTTDQKREFIIGKIRKNTWGDEAYKAERVADYVAMTDEKVEEYYEDNCSDGNPSVFCPICMFEKLDDTDGLMYLLKKNGLTREELATQIGQEFKTYEVFNNYIVPPKTK